MTLIAYHNDPSIKTAIISELEAHRAADQIVQGQYWENGKGCAVGCTVKSANHAEYGPRFGIPEMLARLEDVIFEGLPNSDAQNWPVEFMGAIEPGADLSRVGWQFLHWLLTDEQINPGINHPLVRDAVAQCAAVLERPMRGLAIDSIAAERAAASAGAGAWNAVKSAGSSPASAWIAARSAVESAGSSPASAARSAARSARSVAESAWSARSVAESAWSAESSAAWSAERSAAYVQMGRKLLQLLGSAPMEST